MPGWHEATKELQATGKIQLVGLIQEQHPDRCRLFMQWKEMDWPILVDPVNITASSAVPLVWAIDEYGIVRAVNPRPEAIQETFIDRTFDAPSEEVTVPDHPSSGLAEEPGSPEYLRAQGDVQLLHEGDLSAALASYRKAIAADADEGASHFRLGVALRMRYDSADRQEGDFQAAGNAWSRALEIDPNQYIWRRRIQQYGPRLDKPYPFYDWVEQAREVIAARGETPLPLLVEPRGAELAQPNRTLEEIEAPPHPDPDGRVTRDPGGTDGFVNVETITVPGTQQEGRVFRVHFVFRTGTGTHWNNEAEPMRVWIRLPQGWKSDRGMIEVVPPFEAVSDEDRRVEFEVVIPEEASTSSGTIRAEAFYNVCHDDGICLYRRRDITIQASINH